MKNLLNPKTLIIAIAVLAMSTINVEAHPRQGLKKPGDEKGSKIQKIKPDSKKKIHTPVDGGLLLLLAGGGLAFYGIKKKKS